MEDIPLEMLFVYELIKDVSFYRKQHDGEQVPMIRWDPRDAMWDCDIPQEAAEKLEERVWFGLDDCEFNWLEDEHDIKVNMDNNGYRLLCDIELYKWLEKKQELREEIDWLAKCEEKGEMEADDLCDKLKEIHEELEEDVYPNIMEEAKKWGIFKEWADSFIEGWKTQFVDYVLVEDSEGKEDFVHKDFFNDFEKENGLVLVQR